METTIQLDDKTRDRLKRLGMKSETYDELLIRIMNVYEKYLKEIQAR